MNSPATPPSTDVADLAAIPFLDHHCHPWLRDWQRQDAAAFRACFSESPSAEMVAQHLPRSLPYRRSLRQLAALLGCERSEEAILAVRSAAETTAYLRRLFGPTGLAALLLDDGFPPPADALSVAEIGAASGLPVRRVLRVETLVQELTVQVADFADLLARFDAATGDLAAAGAVALKSIAAYRSGLRLAPVSFDAAAAAWAPLREEARRRGRLRIAAKPVIDFFALRALGQASRQGAAMQFHTGYGDPDLDLREANPLHLRPVLEDGAYRGASVVLLHGAYPYTGEAAFLAAVYPHVYLDVSTALPPLGLAELERTLAAALAVAPFGKVLLSSDGARIPEHHALGALTARAILGSVLRRALASGELDAAEAAALAPWPLHRTAEAVYGDGLGEPPSPAPPP